MEGKDREPGESGSIELMDRLNDPWPFVPGGEGPDADAVARESIELLGLLPYALEPVEPAPQSRAMLLAAIRKDGRRDERHSGSWWLPLAASLLIALLAALVWRQGTEIERQRLAIDSLSAERQGEADLSDRLSAYEDQLRKIQRQLALVTSAGVEVCALRPEYAAAVETNARGALFVASDHQRWYLRIDDLEPCPLGRSYQLWFLGADGSAVDGGILQVEHGVELEISSDSMPASTVAVTVTLEPAGGSEAPSGPTVLYGDEVMRIL